MGIVILVVTINPVDEKMSEQNDFDDRIEALIRYRINRPMGKLTIEDLQKVTEFDLGDNQLTSVKGLEKLNRLTLLNIRNNPALTKAQIDELQKALPNCEIRSNPTK